MRIAEIEFLVDKKNTYKKEFGLSKTEIKENGYTLEGTTNFLKKYIDRDNFRKLSENLSESTILAGVPTANRDGLSNKIPLVYAAYISKVTGKPYIDLNDYIDYRSNSSNRSSTTAKERSENRFSFKFRDSRQLAVFTDLTKGKEIILVDDVITTGETLVHLGNYLKNKIPGSIIKGGTAIVSNGIRKPSTRDAWRFAEKLSALTNDQIPLERLQRLIGEQFGPYTRLKMTRFERGINSPESAFRAIRLMETDRTRINKSLSKSIEHHEKYPKSRTDIER